MLLLYIGGIFLIILSTIYLYRSTLISNVVSKSFSIAYFVSFSEILACSVGIFQSIPRVSSRMLMPPSAFLHKVPGTVAVYLPLSGLPTPPWCKLSAIHYIVDLASLLFLLILPYHKRSQRHKVLFFNS